MAASSPKSSVDLAGERVSSRIAPVDVFRGLTMLVMIFVNDLASVKGLPWWTYHMPASKNGMTYVDIVFPAFLFIVGLALPLSIEQRLRKDPSLLHLWGHVLLRTGSLLVLGLILANAEKGSRAQMGFDTNTWAILALAGMILFALDTRHLKLGKWLGTGLKLSGLGLAVIMLALFRRVGPGGQILSLSTSYWEILGLIGWTYLTVCLLYIPTRRWRLAPLAWFVALILLNVLTTAHWLRFPAELPFYLWPVGSGAFAAMAMAGVVTSGIFLRRSPEGAVSRKLLAALTFAAATGLAALLLTPLGISKIHATASWSLFSVALSVVLFGALFWVCDVKGKRAWAAFVRPAGANTLLTYLLPDLYYFATAHSDFGSQWEFGWAGVVKSLVFTALVLGASAVLTKYRVRLQL